MESGKILLQYRLVEKIGEGGMGVVWKAVDTTLDREVAIKILPVTFSGDPERLARFEREARLLASLNHPGIAAVYGFHVDGGLYFLAMELVSGENLAERLRREPMRVEQALEVAIQVTEALEVAHANGVIHRDLKPANIQITAEGRIKVLDFGLAKAFEPEGVSGSVDLSLSPTVTSAGTLAGVLLGTAAYMSPEQARGRKVDRRTDIWAFGCVLWECLTGRTLFRGESVSDSIGAILHKEPDLAVLPADTPPMARLVLRRCLTRKADDRLHDIADARIDLKQALDDPDGSVLGLAAAGANAARSATGLGTFAVLALALVGLVAGVLGGWLLRGGAEPSPLRKLDLGVRLEQSDNEIDVAIAADGSTVAFAHAGQLWVQALDDLEPRPLAGTDGALDPFWSPDGSMVGYFAQGRLWKVPAIGGNSVAIADLGGEGAGGRGAAWGDGDRIVYSRGNTGLMAVSALGGQPSELLPTGDDYGDYHEPHILPDGRGILFVSHPTDAAPGRLEVVRGAERRVLLDEGERGSLQSPVYDRSGYLLFRRMGGDVTTGLWAMPFSLNKLEATGEPFLVSPDASAGSVSADGTLAFIHRPPSGRQSQLLWVGRAGNVIESVTDTVDGVWTPALSPDEKRLAYALNDGEDPDLWVLDLERGSRTRLTSGNDFDGLPLWTAGDEIVFSRFPDPVHLIVPADGSGDPRELGPGVATAITPDGTSLVVSREVKDKFQVWLAPLDGSSEGEMLLESGSPMFSGGISPDGRYLLYNSEASGRGEVYITRFPTIDGRWQVSVEGGQLAAWGPAGDRIFYRNEAAALVEVSVDLSGGTPRLGRPVNLFDVPELPFGPPTWDMTSDGDRFVIPFPVEPDQTEIGQSGIKVVQNWAREFER